MIKIIKIGRIIIFLYNSTKKFYLIQMEKLYERIKIKKKRAQTIHEQHVILSIIVIIIVVIHWIIQIIRLVRVMGIR